MTVKYDKKEKENHHIRWAEDINLRNARYSEDSNWFPFVQNVQDILERIDYMSQRFDDLENRIGEVDGKIKNLRKILIKLEVIDDRFIF
jgi:predicted adenine nucleotide alpha hydrolase (AANH) superfamily ATPase